MTAQNKYKSILKSFFKSNFLPVNLNKEIDDDLYCYFVTKIQLDNRGLTVNNSEFIRYECIDNIDIYKSSLVINYNETKYSLFKLQLSSNSLI